jgi:quercetin dioxygenase-like cupin family protein
MTSHPLVLTSADDLATGGTAELFRGSEFGADVSFFLNHARAGHTTASHRHPYAEVFVVLDGAAEFTVAGATHGAHGGQVVVVPAGATHAFTNTGERMLEMTSIHPAAEMVTEWIEEA